MVDIYVFMIISLGRTQVYITIDNSITIWAIVGYSPGSGNWKSIYNPKLGIYLGPVWVKAGPSFTVSQKKEFAFDVIKINNTNFNFEVSYIAEF